MPRPIAAPSGVIAVTGPIFVATGANTDAILPPLAVSTHTRKTSLCPFAAASLEIAGQLRTFVGLGVKTIAGTRPPQPVKFPEI